MGRHLSVRFKVPKKRVKNANTSMNYIVSANKSAWLREFAEEVWQEAIKEQFGLEAEEPEIEKIEVNEETQEAIDRIEELKNEAEEADKELKAHEKGAVREAYILARRILRYPDKRTEEEIEKSKKAIHEYEERMKNLKALKKRRTTTLRNFRKIQNKEIQRALRKNDRENRKLYVKEKSLLNKDSQLFRRCHVAITVHNITNRDFDSPNFFPTVKPIIDAGTDTGILWEDDNNNVIRSTVFLAGTNLNRDHYILDIDIYEDLNDLMKKVEEREGVQ